ncbi:helix-turn-helix domain-containing protein [Paenibacillus sp. 22594]|uniref:helix-turn-helix domain-containing protein n=1 Tax=Paenibacillus sp. 22594 TaxID=3453947 RepID=UPI003F86E747
MEATATIRDQLASYLSEQGMSINQFADRSGINSGTLSRIVKGHQPIAMSHLELITKGIGEVEDHFFSLYVDECFYHSAPTWRRLRPFMIRCAELGRMDCIERMVQILLDNLSNVPTLFDVAEGLFEHGQWKAAAILYENVSASEKYQYSERLAVCQYRLFRIALGDDQSENLRAATLFEPYVPRLDEADQLDALKDLAHVYSSLRRWHKVEELAKELLRIASIQYELQYKLDRKWGMRKQPTRPIYGYILYSYLLQSFVCEENEDYVAALGFVSKYADGSWIKESTNEAKQIVNQFKEWAIANTYLYRIMNGDEGVLDEYVDYISIRDNEVFIALFRIVQAANRYSWNIDYILDRFSSYLSYRRYTTVFGDYNKQLTADQYAQFLTELASYYLCNKNCLGIQAILHSMDFSFKINCESNVIKCVDLFEQYRDKASDEETKQYKNLISEVRDHNEKKRESISSFV